MLTKNNQTNSNKLPGKAVKGFTLLEAIVALSIMSFAGLGILQWVSQSSAATERIIASQKQVQREIALLELAKAINPKRNTGNELIINKFKVKWSSSILPVYQDVMTTDRTMFQQIDLFQLQMRLDWDEQELISDFQVSTIGYKKKTVPDLLLP